MIERYITNQKMTKHSIKIYNITNKLNVPFHSTVNYTIILNSDILKLHSSQQEFKANNAKFESNLNGQKELYSKFSSQIIAIIYLRVFTDITTHISRQSDRNRLTEITLYVSQNTR